MEGKRCEGVEGGGWIGVEGGGNGEGWEGVGSGG